MKTLRQILDEANSVATAKIKAQHYTRDKKYLDIQAADHEAEGKESEYFGDAQTTKYHKALSRQFGHKAKRAGQAIAAADKISKGK